MDLRHLALLLLVQPMEEEDVVVADVGDLTLGLAEAVEAMGHLELLDKVFQGHQVDLLVQYMVQQPYPLCIWALVAEVVVKQKMDMVEMQVMVEAQFLYMLLT